MIFPKIAATAAKTAAINPVKSAHSWLPGLNALRFFAAALVVVMHTHNNMGQAGLVQLPAWPVLFKGLTAVSFFFVLSGFLITYLLLQEQAGSGSISIRHFYLRRVFRIWPLYFIIVTAGMLFYWKLVPALHLHFENDYPHSLAILLYTFFLANLMSSLYHVGGMLHIAWSISVEEQFYLFWAPLVKRFYKKMPALIASVTVLSLLVNAVNSFNVFGWSPQIKAFIDTLQFHYMGMGAGMAWLLHTKRHWLLQLSVFTNRWLQTALTTVLIVFLLLYMKTPLGDALVPLPLGLLFGWLIINVSVNNSRIFSLQNAFLDYMGKISYGIYMYHMPVVYAVAFLFQKQLLRAGGGWYFVIYFGLVFVVTTAMAAASFYLVEQPILKRSKKIF